MRINKFCLTVFSALFLFACTNKETENLSRSTFYVAFEINGDNPAIIQVGTPYIDAGAIATENGKVVQIEKITNNVVYDEMGMYQVVYSAINSDGLKSRAVRDVIVCNPAVTTDIGGSWTAAPGCYRFWHSTGAEVPYSGYPVSISRLAPGFFYISDFFAGYYAVRAGYGSGYAMTGYIALNEDNTIDLISSFVRGWGDGLSSLTNAVYDPDAGTIMFESNYMIGTGSDMTFFVTLTK